MAETASLLEVAGLTVEFPGVLALDGVHFEVRAGEVHALVGENGAGKSTLLKVLGGVYQPTGGTLTIDGAPYRPTKPADSLKQGIAVIYQEFNLFPDLTVAENVYAGREPHSRLTGALDYREMRRGCREMFDILNVPIDPDVRVADLGVSEQQLVEIAKALSVGGRIIVMDEPTAALSKEETSRLLDVVRRLKAEGKAVIYVSHRFDEIYAVCERATVLRDGKLIATREIADTTPDELVRLMVGRNVESVFHREKTTVGEVVLELIDLSAGPLRNVNLTVRAGEVLGIGGIAGAGQPELTQVIFGILGVDRGQMLLEGKPFAPANPQDALRAGIGFLHEDRKRAGLLPSLSVKQNLSVSVLSTLRSKFGLLSPKSEAAIYDKYAGIMRIKASSPDQLISQLSGGNQQKVLLGRALAPGGRLLVLNEPTRGVDIGAKAEIHQLVNQLTSEGVAILMVSSDLPELLGMSDEILVLAQGEIRGRLLGDDRNEENVVACSTTDRRIGVAA